MALQIIPTWVMIQLHFPSVKVLSVTLKKISPLLASKAQQANRILPKIVPVIIESREPSQQEQQILHCACIYIVPKIGSNSYVNSKQDRTEIKEEDKIDNNPMGVLIQFILQPYFTSVKVLKPMLQRVA